MMEKNIIIYLLYFLLAIVNHKVAAQSLQEKKIKPYAIFVKIKVILVPFLADTS